MLTFEKWLDEWKIDSDYEPTEKEVDAMRDAWDGAIQTMREAAQQSVQSDVGVCICKNVDEAHRGTWLVCGKCLKPRRG